MVGTALTLLEAFLQLKIELVEELEDFPTKEEEEIQEEIRTCDRVMEMLQRMSEADVCLRVKEFAELWVSAGGDPDFFPSVSVIVA